MLGNIVDISAITFLYWLNKHLQSSAQLNMPQCRRLSFSRQGCLNVTSPDSVSISSDHSVHQISTKTPTHPPPLRRSQHQTPHVHRLSCVTFRPHYQLIPSDRFDRSPALWRRPARLAGHRGHRLPAVVRGLAVGCARGGAAANGNNWTPLAEVQRLGSSAAQRLG